MNNDIIYCVRYIYKRIGALNRGFIYYNIRIISKLGPLVGRYKEEEKNLDSSV